MNDISPIRPLAHLPERLHHYAFVIEDQERNRQFFEDVIGIPLVATWCEHAYNVYLQRHIDYCHTFYALADGGALAFFQYADRDAYEALKSPIPDRGQHFAMRVSDGTYDEIVARLKAAKLPLRETDHGYCRSAYTRSPDGLRVEFTVDHPAVDEINAKQRTDCHAELKRWLSGDHTTNNHDRVAAAAA
jgi:catechol 2,3-dioxygenase-like lactoylglutathione lyase family enzyme